MKSSLLKSVNRLMLLFVVAFTLINSNKSDAQPYCTANYTTGTIYWYDFFGYIARFSMQKSTSTGIDDYARNATPVDPIPPANLGTGMEQYKHTKNPVVQMKIGNTYQFKLNVHGWGSQYTRLFIDLNGDGDFNDVVNGVNEFRGTIFNNFGFIYNFSLPYPEYYVKTNRVVTFTGINIPCNAVPITGSRIRVMTAYGVNNGADACSNGYNYQLQFGYNLWYGEVEDYDMDIVPDAPQSFPTDESILYAKESYDGTQRQRNGSGPLINFPKPNMTFVGGAPTGTTLQMSIRGPLPSTNTVWTALEPGTNNSTITVTNAIPAGGSFIPSNSTGFVDEDGNRYSPGNNGSVKFWEGGEYQLVIAVGGAGCPGAVIRNFTAALDYDLAAKGIVSPRTNLAPSFLKYQNNSDIKVVGSYINVGLNPVNKFKAIYKIYRPDGQIAKEGFINYDDQVPPYTTINPGQSVEVDFGTTFRTSAIGVYTMEISLEWAADQGSFNNTFPRPGATAYPFEVQYDIQVAANKIFAPAQGEKLIANRPFIPRAEFINRGISPVSDVMVTYQAKKASTGEVVYQQSRTLEDISSGRYNTNSMSWGAMVLPDPGSYIGCAWIYDANDPIRSDDTTCVTFEVESGIQGTFTVGNLKETSAGYKVDRNFLTVSELMDALYYDGLSGSTVIEFTDPEYIITAANEAAPAWDFSSRILGLGLNDFTKQVQTLTFRPATNRAALKGGVVLKLQAASGMGIRFGQNLFPTNSNAIVNTFPSKINANSAGYITFDGGTQKTIKMELDVLTKASATSQIFGAAVYMARGTENITIKNCLIETITSAIKNRVNVPNIIVSSTDTRYDRDEVLLNSVWQSYSAGIVSRNTLVPLVEQAQLGLDTINNRNNVIEGNEITKFGYGIVSLGAGPLFDADAAVFRRYYNNNNKYQNNLIYDVTRAGILLGNEEKSSVKGNRIHTVSGTGSNRSDAAGIMLGGNGSTTVKGYNSIDMAIDGNEINNVNSSINATGIRVEQVRATFGTGNNITSFPNVAENVSIMNNVVWGINTTSASGVRAGIHLYTERANPTVYNGMNLLTPREGTYFTRNDKVVNNTVIMESGSNPQIGSNGALVGIGLQSGTNTTFRNNAIAVLDQNINNATALTGTAVLYQGIRPNMTGGTTFDRNAYFTGVNNPLTSNISLVRHVETNATQTILGAGSFNEYLTLEQWNAAYAQDLNSIVGNFTNDMVKSGLAPFTYTVKSNPTPLGSILNNRGDKLSYVTSDITNVSRGVAGQRYDIGAVEFAGRTNLSDVEMLSIAEPRVYQASTGTFSDAQYIMTKAPIAVVGQLRNNGSLLQTEMEVTVNIYRQNADGLTFPTVPLLTKKVKSTLASSETVMADFKLADGDSDDFTPQTYFELTGQGYSAPSTFTEMRANVTPIYRIEMSVEADQQNANNIVTKDVRFYLRKTNREIIVSGESLSADVESATTTPNDMMAKLNYSYAIQGLNSVNYKLNLKNLNAPVYDFDVFDRNSWEPRAVNYGEYAFMFYSDGNGSQITRTQTEDIEKYMSLGTVSKKRNFVAVSEELARNTNTNYPLFARNVLRTEWLNNNPNGNGTDYDNGLMVGDQLAKSYTFTIAQPINPNTTTTYPGDVKSMPAVIKERNSYVENNRTIQLPGLASAGIRYNKAGQTTDISAVVSTTLETNAIYVGADWRHISNIGTLIRGVISFFESNGSVVIPVELTSFEAKQIANNVAITWETASEVNSSMFEVEKANVSGAGVGAFAVIANKEAAGFSNTAKYYGPVMDNSVKLGNTYAYRLKTLDKDGSSNYSEERIVSLTSEAGMIELGNPSPNPAANESSLFLNLSQNNSVEVMMYDVNGVQLNTQSFNGIAGANTINLNTVGLASGSYTVVVKVGEVRLTRTINVIK